MEAVLGRDYPWFFINKGLLSSSTLTSCTPICMPFSFCPISPGWIPAGPFQLPGSLGLPASPLAQKLLGQSFTARPIGLVCILSHETGPCFPGRTAAGKPCWENSALQAQEKETFQPSITSEHHSSCHSAATLRGGGNNRGGGSLQRSVLLICGAWPSPPSADHSEACIYT